MKINNTTLKSRDTSVMAGIDKHITSSITINGVAYTPGDLKAVFQSQLTAIATAEALHKSLADGVVNARAVATKVNTMYHLLRSALIAQYGSNANAVLNDFGMTAPKAAGAKTVQVKATAAAKRAATRTARNTMGAVQKKAVTGNVVGLTMTPVIAGKAGVAATAATPSTTSPATPPAVVAPSQAVTAPAPTAPAAGATTPAAPAPHAS